MEKSKEELIIVWEYFIVNLQALEVKLIVDHLFIIAVINSTQVSFWTKRGKIFAVTVGANFAIT